MVIVPASSDSVGAGRPGDQAWRRSLRRAVRDPDALCRLLELPAQWAAAARRAAAAFPLLVPREYLARIRPGDPHDPLLRQVLPLEEELRTGDGFARDPVGDGQAVRAPGLLQKYAGRALLMAAGGCAVHCRYCFRRHTARGLHAAAAGRWRAALEQLAAERTIDEVVLSGGDPLMLTDRRLSRLLDALERIAHLRRLRLHTRLPIVIPARITDSLLRRLRRSRLTVLVVVHANHPNELDEPTSGALERLVAAGLPTLNQSVLLRGVNDRAETLERLCRRLVDRGVLPYYLHQLDRVAGAAHFETPPELGPELIRRLRAVLPGYAVPRLVRERPGAPSKDVLA